MTKLEEMWVALLAYLPQAIAAGHGDSWARMCSEKTANAASAAYDAAWAAYAAYDAAYDAYYAVYVSAYAYASDSWAQKAIDRITEITESI